MTRLDAEALSLAARQLLSKGDADGAERVLAPVFKHLRGDAASLHLMGQIKKAQNKLDEAERYLRSAVAFSLSEGAYYNDLGVVLQARGELGEAKKVLRAALALIPGAAAVRVNLVQCLLASGELAEAEKEAQAYIKAQPGAEAWTLLGQVQRAQDRHIEALASAEAALKFGPKLRGLRYNHAAALDRLGRTKEALDVYEALARHDLDTPDLALNFARALFLEGRKKDAEAVAERGVDVFPSSAPLHTTLARMRWLRGDGEASTERIEKEIERRPNDLALRLACADILHRGQHLPKALRVLDQALRIAPNTPALLSAFGIVLDELDRPLDGLKVLQRVVELTNGARSAHRNMLSTLLRAGRPEDALKVVRALRADDKEEQYLIACEATAQRMLGDPAYKTWCDFDSFVRIYDIPAPRGFFTPQNFNAALAEVLRAQHRTNAHPLDQTLHRGSQTQRSLLALDDHHIKSLMAAVDVAVRDYITRLPQEPDHPIGHRRGKHYRYSGLWSLRLTSEGYQPNHVHDRGWISSAYYVNVLPAERVRNPQSGWLRLGEPNRPPLGCGPERMIEPKPGQLILFPSYMWHGVASFEGDERLSAAFDVIPG